MSSGLQIFDSAGNVVLDTSTRLTRILGTQYVYQDGSFSVSLSSGARLFAYIVAGAQVKFNSLVPAVRVSGNSVSWALNGQGVGGYGGFQGQANLLVWGEF